MNSFQTIQFHVVDATPGALGRWSARVRGVQDASVRIWSEVPGTISGTDPCVWVLVPDSFSCPTARGQVFAIADEATEPVVVVQNRVLEQADDFGSAFWMDSKEPEHSFSRTFSLLSRTARDRCALRAALASPVDSQEAVRRNREMETESRNKDEFLATMSHELRTPLNAILSCTEAMREGAYGYMDSEQLDAVGTIRESGKHLLCLINDILDISKIAAGRLELSTATLGVGSVCDSVVEIVRSSAAAKNISIELDNESSVTTIKGDPLRLKQILLNLLGNAIKFSPEGSRVGLRVYDDNDSGDLAFCVWDSGPGVSSACSDAIFKPFVQAEGGYSRSSPGTGLGLAIARDLARLHSGDLVLEAFDRPGAVFTLSVPVEEGDEEDVFDFRATGAWSVDDSSMDADEPAESIERVLIAEDTDSNFQHIHDLLVSMGYAVERACNGQEAVELAQDAPPDLVLMDIDMPVMNGLDAIRLLREDPGTQAIPIIAVTAMADIADERACMSAGADGFLAKPYPLRDLMTLMQTVAS